MTFYFLDRGGRGGGVSVVSSQQLYGGCLLGGHWRGKHVIVIPPCDNGAKEAGW